MATIVKEMRAGDLPPALREGIDPEHAVRVSVTDLGSRSADLSAADLIRSIEAHRAAGRGRELSLEDSVREIRELREEW